MKGGWSHTGEGGTFWRLAEKLADLLVHVTQEVHVRRSPTGALVLHQEVPKYQLGPVFLFHHCQLQRTRRGEGEEEGVPERNKNLCHYAPLSITATPLLSYKTVAGILCVS